MIIRLAFPSKNLTDKKWRDKYLNCLENLATAHAEGKHFLAAEEHGLFKALSGIPELSQRARATFLRLNSESVQTNSLVSSIQNNCWVLDTISAVQGRGSGAFEVPLSFFEDSGSIQPSIFLCENSSESEFYEFLGRGVLQQKKIIGNPFVLNYELRNGGGAGIGHEFKTLSRDRFALCIVDGDRKCPGSELGGTAKSLGTSLHNQPPIHQLHVTESREVENLVPLKALKTVSGYRNRKEIQVGVDWDRALIQLEKLIELLPQLDVVRYFDFKEGMDWGEVLEAEVLPCGNYLRVSLKQAGIPDCGLKRNCHSNCKKTDGCECKLLIGFGDKMLDKVINTFHLLSEKDRLHLIESPDASNAERLEIGEKVATVFFAPKAKRV